MDVATDQDYHSLEFQGVILGPNGESKITRKYDANMQNLDATAKAKLKKVLTGNLRNLMF